MLLIQQLYAHQGALKRGKFILSILASAFLSLIISIIPFSFLATDYPERGILPDLILAIIPALSVLSFIYSSLALCIKRFNDTGIQISPLLILGFFVLPFTNLLFVLFLMAYPSQEKNAT